MVYYKDYLKQVKFYREISKWTQTKRKSGENQVLFFE